MKKLVVLFVAIMFLATFTLIGCNQSAPPAPEKGAPGAPAALSTRSNRSTCAGTGEGSTRSARSARSTWSTRSTCASTRKILDAGYRGISSPRGYTPDQLHIDSSDSQLPFYEEFNNQQNPIKISRAAELSWGGCRECAPNCSSEVAHLKSRRSEI